MKNTFLALFLDTTNKGFLDAVMRSNQRNTTSTFPRDLDDFVAILKTVTGSPMVPDLPSQVLNDKF